MIKTAMILAAGLGQRMRPLTNTIPKPLVSVAGKCMLERAFEHIKSAGISKIVVNSHYLAPLIEEFIKKNYPDTLVSHEEILLETGGGIKKALPLIGEGAFFSLNGDSIWTGANSLIAMEKLWDPIKMDALLLLIPRDKAYGYIGKGDFSISENGQLARPEKGQEAPYVYIGVQITHSAFFDGAPEGAFSLNVLWNKSLTQGRLYGCVHQGDWFHISTPEDLRAFEPMVGMSI
ncbi:MAG: nucleotidyltransferase family protein [Proteobacteria bacterium]|nr:nucleotidyltransferase family protein [Pseudomonadota bacterium]